MHLVSLLLLLEIRTLVNDCKRKSHGHCSTSCSKPRTCEMIDKLVLLMVYEVSKLVDNLEANSVLDSGADR